MAQDAPPFDQGDSPPDAPAAATSRVRAAAGPSAPVMIVEDHPLFADALAVTLETRLGLGEVRRAETLGAALAAMERGFAPGTVLLDLNLPDVTGLDGLARIRDAAPEAAVVVVSSFVDARLASAALRLGADGVLGKDSARDAIAGALRAVWAGERVAPEGVTLDGGPGDDPEGPAAADAARRLASLTPQQARILDLVCLGMLNKQIAYELDIAETTVKAHISAILRKLGVQSRTQAVLAAQKVRFDGASGSGERA
ncbi:MAG TPA: response regulator transcription factor [Paracoccaceae bacterium]|nr:response regulator transcription factor [Paracoccaceae bacterium]